MNWRRWQRKCVRALPERTTRSLLKRNETMENKPEGRVVIDHNAGENRFETTVDGHQSVAEYELRDGGIVFTHTFVPPELRGRGIAAKLVQHALEYARDQKLRVVPLCSYVADYIERHPEFKPMVV